MRSSLPYVLYVDDEPGNRLIFKTSFESQYAILLAKSAEEALELLSNEEHRVALVITDQRMPGLSGNALLRVLKEDHPSCIRAVLTAFSELDPILQAINEGLVSRYLIKPWHREEMNELITWAMDVYRIGEQNSAAQARVLEQERLATLGTVFQAMIHDLNQPLSYFVLNLNQLQTIAEYSDEIRAAIEGRSSKLDTDQRSTLVKCMAQMPSIVADMLGGAEYLQTAMHDAKRFVSQKHLARDTVLTDPHEAVSYSFNVCRHLAQKAKVSLENAVERTPMRLLIGYSVFCQIMINLVRNAIQALADETDNRPGSVRIYTEATQERVVFLIEDDGPGMDSDEIARLGRGFYSTREGGSGIGIMQCYRLVGMTGGRFTIESELGRGTTARVELLRA